MSRTDPRAELVARWLELTREVMPSMAASARWPVRFDHCFMRICLDTAFGAPWTQMIATPAVRTMSAAQLEAAIDVAERVVADPGLLSQLNKNSLSGRQAKAAA